MLANRSGTVGTNRIMAGCPVVFRWAGVRDTLNTWHTSRGYVPHLITWGRCVKWGGVRDRVRDSRPEGPPKPTRNRTESVTGAGAFGGARRSQGF